MDALSLKTLEATLCPSIDNLSECCGEDREDVSRSECLPDSAEMQDGRSNAERILHAGGFR